MAQPAADQHGDHRMVAQFTRSRRSRVIEQPEALFGRQPVLETDAETTDALTRRMPAASSGLRSPASAASTRRGDRGQP
jgi:hypothetical protein